MVDYRLDLKVGLDSGALSALKKVAESAKTVRREGERTNRALGKTGAGARRFTRNLKGTEVQANRTARAMLQIQSSGGLFSGFGALGAGITGIVAATYGVQRFTGALIQMSDEVTRFENQMRVVTDTAAGFRQVQDRLIKTSAETGLSVSEAGALYQRFSVALENTGATAKETADIVDTLARTSVVFGLGQEEAAGAIRQLTQGLAAGELRGQELRSVLEQLTPVSRAIAREMNVTHGSLLKLAEAGALTPEVVLPALRGLREEIQGLYKDVELPIDQRLAALWTQASLAVGALGDLSGVTESFTTFLTNLVSQLQAFNKGLTETNSLAIGLQGYLNEVAETRGFTRLEHLLLAIVSVMKQYETQLSKSALTAKKLKSEISILNKELSDFEVESEDLNLASQVQRQAQLVRRTREVLKQAEAAGEREVVAGLRQSLTEQQARLKAMSEELDKISKKRIKDAKAANKTATAEKDILKTLKARYEFLQTAEGITPEERGRGTKAIRDRLRREQIDRQDIGFGADLFSAVDRDVQTKAAAERATVEEREFRSEQKRLAREAADAQKRALQEVADAARETAQTIGTSLVGAFAEVTRASGIFGDKWGRVADVVIQEIGRLIVQYAALKAAQAAQAPAQAAGGAGAAGGAAGAVAGGASVAAQFGPKGQAIAAGITVASAIVSTLLSGDRKRDEEEQRRREMQEQARQAEQNIRSAEAAYRQRQEMIALQRKQAAETQALKEQLQDEQRKREQAEREAREADLQRFVAERDRRLRTAGNVFAGNTGGGERPINLNVRIVDDRFAAGSEAAQELVMNAMDAAPDAFRQAVGVRV